MTVPEVPVTQGHKCACWNCRVYCRNEVTGEHEVCKRCKYEKHYQGTYAEIGWTQ